MARARSLSEFQKAFSDEASCVASCSNDAGRTVSSALAPANAARRCCLGSPHITSRRAIGISSNETILASVLKRSGVRRAAARRPPEGARTARRPHRASDEINPSNRHSHYIYTNLSQQDKLPPACLAKSSDQE